jgi:hypothetical protein
LFFVHLANPSQTPLLSTGASAAGAELPAT